MVVQVAFVQMGGDDELKLLAPHLTSQLYTDLMAPLRGDFSRFEALVPMPGDVVVLLAVLLFGQDHLLEGRLLQAVDDGGSFRSRLRYSAGVRNVVPQQPDVYFPASVPDQGEVFCDRLCCTGVVPGTGRR